MKLVAYWIVLEWQKQLASGFPDGPDSEESACNGGDPGSIPGSGSGNPWRSPLERGQRSLVGYSSWGHKELDTIEQLEKKNMIKTSFKLVSISFISFACYFNTHFFL